MAVSRQDPHQGAYRGGMLEDGSYDIIVIDADQLAGGVSDGGGDSVVRLDLTILAGTHKGEIVSMRAVGLGIDEITALGLPGTLTVHQGEPSVALDTQ